MCRGKGRALVATSRGLLALPERSVPGHRPGCPVRFALALCLFALSGLAEPASAATLRLNAPPAGQCPLNSALELAISALRPGDQLVLGGGEYCSTGRRYFELAGTAEKPIVIKAAPGETPVITRPWAPGEPAPAHGIEFKAAHLKLFGLHIRGGARGLVFHHDSHHVTVEGCEVSGTSNNALTLNNGDTWNFVIRRNHLHHTGLLDSAYGETEGEGIYIGCHRGGCAGRDHLVEGNYIHDLGASGGGGNDGIEIKYGSYGNVVRDNVVHGILPGLNGYRFPCIFAYGVRDPRQHAPNIIEGNAVWDCGEGIQVVADAIVRNNLVLHSSWALATYYHQVVPRQRNLSIVNNTFFGSVLNLSFGKHAGEPPTRKPSPAGIVFANNAIYGLGIDPLVKIDLPLGGDIAIRGNALHPLREGSVAVVRQGGVVLGANAFFDGGPAAEAFIDPAGGDYRPGPNSKLVGRAEHRYLPTLDFAGQLRSSPGTVGAYSAGLDAAVAPWRVGPGPKTPLSRPAAH